MSKIRIGVVRDLLISVAIIAGGGYFGFSWLQSHAHGATVFDDSGVRVAATGGSGEAPDFVIHEIADSSQGSNVKAIRDVDHGDTTVESVLTCVQPLQRCRRDVNGDTQCSYRIEVVLVPDENSDSQATFDVQSTPADGQWVRLSTDRATQQVSTAVTVNHHFADGHESGASLVHVGLKMTGGNYFANTALFGGFIFGDNMDAVRTTYRFSVAGRPVDVEIDRRSSGFSSFVNACNRAMSQKAARRH
jgi:hypothetical protein